MAKVKLSSGAIFSGKVGGMVYSHNKSGAYVRNYVVPVNPNTRAQSETRQRFADLSNDWKGLTDAQRLTWIAAAPNFPQVDRVGNTIYLSGQGLYMKMNRNLQTARQSTITVAPAPKVVASPFFTTVTVDSSTFSVGYTPDPLGTNDNLIIECSRVVSAGKKFAGRSSFKLVAVVAGTTISPADIFALYNVIFGAGSLQAGSKVFIRLKIVDGLTGITSDSLQDSFVIA